MQLLGELAEYLHIKSSICFYLAALVQEIVCGVLIIGIWII